MGGLSKQESESNEIFSSRLISTQDAIELFRMDIQLFLLMMKIEKMKVI